MQLTLSSTADVIENSPYPNCIAESSTSLELVSVKRAKGLQHAPTTGGPFAGHPVSIRRVSRSTTMYKKIACEQLQ